jgi:hypothetical protein
LTVLSPDADASRAESWEKATDRTDELWPLSVLRVWRHLPLLVFQILIVLSSDADASWAESWEKATDLTQSLCPSSVCRHSPLLASQNLIVLSPDADTSQAELGENTTDVMKLLWPSSVCRQVFHSSLIAGVIVIHFGSSSLKRRLIRLWAGLNRSADAYV